MKYTYLSTPIGRLLLTGTENSQGCALNAIYLTKNQPSPGENWQHQPEIFASITVQLSEYFAGKRRDFDFPINLGGTEFQQLVLREVIKIPYGKTAGYGEIAALINNPKASRAVGLANATNRLPIVVPCHRVIGKSGKLTGYAGGVEAKEWLLNLEKSILNAKSYLANAL